MSDQEKLDADFVKVWQKSASAEEVAAKLGMPVKACTNKAAYLRRHGVPLKRFRKGTRPTDFKKLAKLAGSIDVETK